MPTRTFNVDPRNSTVEFAAVYATNSIIKGRFNVLSGILELDESEPANSRLSIEVLAGSVDTNNGRRDDQIRGPDFLDATRYDYLRFQSETIEVVEDQRWNVTGGLEIRGQSRPVTIDARYYGIVNDAFGDERAGLVGEAELSRSGWGLNWNMDQDDGGVLISDAVRVHLYISALPAVESDVDEKSPEDAPQDDDSEWSPPRET